MGLKQNIIGKNSELKIADFFKKHYYWAFVIPKGVNGQPFDIIARKGNITFFVDAKHLDSDIFSFERIEPNQISSMRYARVVADITDNMGFVINKEEEFYYLPYELYVELEAAGCKGIAVSHLEKLEYVLKVLENENHYSK